MRIRRPFCQRLSCWITPFVARPDTLLSTHIGDHRSHFGSRYTSGCCALAGLLPRPVLLEPRRLGLGSLELGRRRCERYQRQTHATTVAILAQGTHRAVATSQAFLANSCPTRTPLSPTIGKLLKTRRRLTRSHLTQGSHRPVGTQNDLTRSDLL